MTEKQPVWKDGTLWVWSDLYKRYVANYCLPIHQIIGSGMTVAIILLRTIQNM